MSSSTLAHNVAYGVHPTDGTAAFGGAAFVYQVDFVDSTVSGNSARHRSNPMTTSYDIGGGISDVHGGLVISSTIDSNYAYSLGGGLATFDNILVRNSTLSGNTAPDRRRRRSLHALPGACSTRATARSLPIADTTAAAFCLPRKMYRCKARSSPATRPISGTGADLAGSDRGHRRRRQQSDRRGFERDRDTGWHLARQRRSLAALLQRRSHAHARAPRGQRSDRCGKQRIAAVVRSARCRFRTRSRRCRRYRRVRIRRRPCGHRVSAGAGRVNMGGDTPDRTSRPFLVCMRLRNRRKGLP